MSSFRRSAACANCGSALGGPFCAGCGQRDAPLDPTARELAVDAAQELLGVDGKLLTTARLLFRPGRLTVDYFAGRRVAHVGPVRIYLVCSALLFALLALQPSSSARTRPNSFKLFGLADVAISIPIDPGDAERLAHRSDRSVVERIALRVRAALDAGPERHAELEQRTANAIPQAFFILVPAYAAVVWLSSPRPRRHYPAHLCYALHVHAFVFCVLASALAIRLGLLAIRHAAGFDPRYLGLINAGQLTAFACAVAASVAYVPFAHRRVYGDTWLGTSLRVAVSTSAYFVVFVVGLLLLLIAVLLVG